MSEEKEFKEFKVNYSENQARHFYIPMPMYLYKTLEFAAKQMNQPIERLGRDLIAVGVEAVLHKLGVVVHDPEFTKVNEELSNLGIEVDKK